MNFRTSHPRGVLRTTQGCWQNLFDKYPGVDRRVYKQFLDLCDISQPLLQVEVSQRRRKGALRKSDPVPGTEQRSYETFLALLSPEIFLSNAKRIHDR